MTDRASYSDDDLRALIALLSLDHMSPNRMEALTTVEPPAQVVAALRSGRLPPITTDIQIPPKVASSWCHSMGATVDGVDLDAHRCGGHHVITPADAAWPFANDPYPPPMLFARGDLGLLDDSPSVAVVGTRRCTSVGREVAASLGLTLGRAGVRVVSGLALGVDAAAHRGTLDVGGRAIGVVACGLDVVYPRSNATLWEQVATDGLLLSEVPLGRRPTRWRFPARNRLIAALSDLVVVVESHARGGALSTADEATVRGIPVGAVPGSTLSPASAGTNALLFDGAMPIRDADDVLLALELTPPHVSQPAATLSSGQLSLRLDDLSGPERQVLDAIAGGAVHLDRLIELLGAPPPMVGAVIDGLVARGVVELQGHTVVGR